MRPKGVPNKLTSAVKSKLDGIIDKTRRGLFTICNATQSV